MNGSLTKDFGNLAPGVTPSDLSPENDRPRETGRDRADRMED